MQDGLVAVEEELGKMSDGLLEREDVLLEHEEWQGAFAQIDERVHALVLEDLLADH